MKQESFWTTEEQSSEGETLSMGGNFAWYVLDKVLITRIYKELKTQRFRKQTIQLKMLCTFQQWHQTKNPKQIEVFQKNVYRP